MGDRIREYGYAGVKVDEDFKRYYPFGELASKVLGFTGGDNQGIIGLEVQYEEVLKGINGKILTTTDARGIEIDGIGESRVSRRRDMTFRSVWTPMFRPTASRPRKKLWRKNRRIMCRSC